MLKKNYSDYFEKNGFIFGDAWKYRNVHSVHLFYKWKDFETWVANQSNYDGYSRDGITKTEARKILGKDPFKSPDVIIHYKTKILTFDDVKIYKVTATAWGADAPSQFFYNSLSKAQKAVKKFGNGEIDEIYVKPQMLEEYEDGCTWDSLSCYE